ncbi:endopeptidase La [Lachnoanaerobaculum sp. Marseille-Q4761]|jgi:endopeptidase La|uniref:endopeptidase La n=1 Tax=Lachnoanaerobaculum sp. Marseille-Q4761 TaxID=2819511 RepID=UPI001AA0E252|nr:endopeptidase La [Lachnoanaerobaculum sp. Marseille-Q4761]MBO1869706.1 endopeptidase La [Lachnoanaerobaculum sp. Marseille-Q4761]
MILIPTYNTVVLPGSKIYFRKEYLQEAGVEKISVGEKVTFLYLKEPKDKDITMEDIYPIAVAGQVLSIDDEGGANLEAFNRINIEYMDFENQNVVGVQRPEIDDLEPQSANTMLIGLRDELLNYVTKFQWGLMARGYVLAWKNMNEVMVGLSPFMNITPEEKYAVLAEDSTKARAELIAQYAREFMAINEVSEEAKQAQKELHEKAYREDAIKKQINFLQKALDEMHPENISEVRKFEEKIENSGMNETARKEADNVLNRMKQEGKDSHEYGLLYNYLDFVTSLQWKKEEPKDIELDNAMEVLDREHYGLKKVKKRIIEQLAVMSLNKKQSGSILLFVGAPGTGKTSIGKSIAEALGREYVRISLGGVRDEADIRGHRRTYIGAMPGRIMDGMKKAATSNPVMVLDEIDKLAISYNGDPASALLEVLDPEQNNTFTDHYMNVPYDLSDVLFVCTANSLDTIPGPLLDRMEVIRFTGYTALEKFSIAKDHLIPKAKKKAGISEENLIIEDDTIKALINGYTMEAGVRGLKKQISSLCRHAAVELVKNNKEILDVKPEDLQDYLDQRPIRHEGILEKKHAGVVTGLAWTAVGGEILFIETMLTKGKGNIKITGQLGDVMKESVDIALSLVKNMYPEKAEVFEKNDIHIHVPAGAVPKDGPSAGITMTTAIASLVNNIPVSPEYAMTGEVSLRGRVMPIGGLPEKLMAAARAGIKKVFIPEENKDDLKEVAEEVLNELEIIPVKKVEDVLGIVLK